jgi:hypothetical protein
MPELEQPSAGLLHSPAEPLDDSVAPARRGITRPTPARTVPSSVDAAGVGPLSQITGDPAPGSSHLPPGPARIPRDAGLPPMRRRRL